ncbi:MAG: T9SS type A sorting domain-containing protein [Bacteroidia bacterium]
MYETGEGDLIVYPNPSSGIFKFTLESESDELITIRVYDASGKLVVSKTGGHAFEEIHIDASELTAGIYMAVVSQGELTKTVKLTKVN